MNYSRRGFLRTTLGAAWTSASLMDQAFFRAAAARAQSKTAASNLFDIEKLADGVYAAIARPVMLLNCNAAIFVNSDGVLVVDTHSKPSAVAALTAQIRKEITPKPVKYVVNSHFHWDHSQGTISYRKTFPNAVVMASDATRRLLAESGGSRALESVAEAQKQLETLKTASSAEKSAPARALLAARARDVEDYIREMRDYQPELPSITTSDTLVIHDKNHELHLVFRGRAHTAGDVAVFCPQKKVIATGDALHGFFPYMGDSYPLEWPRTLYAWAQFDFELVAPGHASVQHGKDKLFHKAAYIEDVTEKVRVAKAKGTPLADVVRTITPDRLPALSRNNFGVAAAESVLRYSVGEPGATVETIIRDTVRTNVEHAYARL
jgi:glyoxylase-like metal-dependent hydrolase (beta-lactamase superfamily II)